jgi:murein DD-endopeptidase MepM/ murein hydrolase activator NlpD
VVAGETVFGIAQTYGTTVDAVLAANGLDRSSIIYPGQTLDVAAAAPAATPAPASAPASPANAALNAPQAENAAMIIRIGRELGVSDRGIAIALATSMVESWLRNLDWGDRDSLGLFQQRPSTGWGTAEQIQDRDRSIRAFYGGPTDPNGGVTRGLLDIPGWESMSFSAAAQAVQISAYPERYAQWEAQAYQWLALYG